MEVVAFYEHLYQLISHYKSEDDPGDWQDGRLFLYPKSSNKQNGGTYMEFFNQAIDILKILVMALGAGLAVWGVPLSSCCALSMCARAVCS